MVPFLQLLPGPPHIPTHLNLHPFFLLLGYRQTNKIVPTPQILSISTPPKYPSFFLPFSTGYEQGSKNNGRK